MINFDLDLLILLKEKGLTVSNTSLVSWRIGFRSFQLIVNCRIKCTILLLLRLSALELDSDS